MNKKALKNYLVSFVDGHLEGEWKASLLRDVHTAKLIRG